jgi:hypothetical protein
LYVADEHNIPGDWLPVSIPKRKEFGNFSLCLQVQIGYWTYSANFQTRNGVALPWNKDGQSVMLTITVHLEPTMKMRAFRLPPLRPGPWCSAAEWLLAFVNKYVMEVLVYTKATHGAHFIRRVLFQRNKVITENGVHKTFPHFNIVSFLTSLYRPATCLPNFENILGNPLQWYVFFSAPRMLLHWLISTGSLKVKYLSFRRGRTQAGVSLLRKNSEEWNIHYVGPKIN